MQQIYEEITVFGNYYTLKWRKNKVKREKVRKTIAIYLYPQIKNDIGILHDMYRDVYRRPACFRHLFMLSLWNENNKSSKNNHDKYLQTHIISEKSTRAKSHIHTLWYDYNIWYNQENGIKISSGLGIAYIILRGTMCHARHPMCIEAHIGNLKSRLTALHAVSLFLHIIGHLCLATG